MNVLRLTLLAACGLALATVTPLLANDPAPEIDESANPFADAIEYAQKRTVKLYGGGIGREHGYASGIVVSDEGHILVAHGVYISSIRLRVVMHDGRIYPAEIERRSENLQAVLLKIDAKTPLYFELADKPNVAKGDWVLGVSNVFKVADRDEQLSVNMGVVSLRTEIDAKKRAIDMDIAGEVLLIDAITSNPGNPGGALMTADGKLAGMIGKLIQSKSTNTWLNYAVPSDRLKPFVEGKEEAIVKNTSDEKPYMGFKLFVLNKRSPAYIDKVYLNTPAHKAGLRTDDLILAINGDVVRDVKEYKELFDELVVGEEVTIIFKRKNDVFSARLTPVAEPK